MAFSSLMGLTVDYLVGTPPGVSVLVDYRIPGTSSGPILTDYASAHFGPTPVETDYAVVETVSALRANTASRTMILVVQRYDTSCLPVGFNVGEPFYNPLAVGFNLRSTEVNTATAISLSIGTTEIHPALPVGFVLGTEFIGPVLPVGFNVGTEGHNIVPVGMNVESASRRLDVDVSIITTELQEVEEEP